MAGYVVVAFPLWHGDGGDDYRVDEQFGVSGAGAGDEQRWRQRLVGVGAGDPRRRRSRMRRVRPRWRWTTSSWTCRGPRPAANGASITDYDVRYCDDSTGCDVSTEWTELNDSGSNATSTATTASITGLTNDTDYQVQVRAGNSVGDGAWSGSTKATPTAQKPSAPAAPTLTYSDESLSALSGLRRPTTGRRSLITTCGIATDSTGCANDSDWTPLNDTGNNSTSTATTATISSLTNGTDYQVQVRGGQQRGRRAVVGFGHREALHSADQARHTHADGE